MLFVFLGCTIVLCVLWVSSILFARISKGLVLESPFISFSTQGGMIYDRGVLKFQVWSPKDASTVPEVETATGNSRIKELGRNMAHHVGVSPDSQVIRVPESRCSNQNDNGWEMLLDDVSVSQFKKHPLGKHPWLSRCPVHARCGALCPQRPQRCDEAPMASHGGPRRLVLKSWSLGIIPICGQAQTEFSLAWTFWSSQNDHILTHNH